MISQIVKRETRIKGLRCRFMNKIIECVPNFSEGKDKAVINAIAAAISSVKDVTLLNVDPVVLLSFNISLISRAILQMF